MPRAMRWTMSENRWHPGAPASLGNPDGCLFGTMPIAPGVRDPAPEREGHTTERRRRKPGSGPAIQRQPRRECQKHRDDRQIYPT